MGRNGQRSQNEGRLATSLRLHVRRPSDRDERGHAASRDDGLQSAHAAAQAQQARHRNRALGRAATVQLLHQQRNRRVGARQSRLGARVAANRQLVQRRHRKVLRRAARTRELHQSRKAGRESRMAAHMIGEAADRTSGLDLSGGLAAKQ